MTGSGGEWFSVIFASRSSLVQGLKSTRTGGAGMRLEFYHKASYHLREGEVICYGLSQRHEKFNILNIRFLSLFQ